MPKASPKQRVRPAPAGRTAADIYIKPDPDAPASARIPLAVREEDDDPLAITPNPITHRQHHETSIPIVRRNRASTSGKRKSDEVYNGRIWASSSPPCQSILPPAPPPIRAAAHVTGHGSRSTLHAKLPAKAPVAQPSSSIPRLINDGLVLNPFPGPGSLDEEDGDVILTSGDGYTFRCHSFHLKSASPVLRDHIAARSPAGCIRISIPEKGYMVFHFLHLQLVGSFHNDTSDMDDMDLDDADAVQYTYNLLGALNSLIAMCDRYQATRFDQILISQYTRLAAGAPWEVFVTACKRSWPTVAREAIRFFDCMPFDRAPGSHHIVFRPPKCKRSHKCTFEWRQGSRPWGVGDLSLAAAEELGLAGYHALAQAIEQSEHSDQCDSWSDVAKEFRCPGAVQNGAVVMRNL